MRHVLGVEKLTNKLMNKILSNFVDNTGDSIKKFGHCEEYPEMKIVWQVRFKDMESVQLFEQLWAKAVEPFDGEYPVNYSGSDEVGDDIVGVFNLHWNGGYSGDDGDLPKLTAVARKGIKLGLLKASDVKNDVSACKSEVQGELEWTA